MKIFGKILRFELKNYLTNKVFVGITAFLMVALVLVLFFPRIAGVFDDGAVEDTGDKPVMLVAGDGAQAVFPSFQAAFTDYEVRLYEGAVEQLQEQIRAEEVECAFVLEGLTSYSYHVENLSLYDANTAVADELLREVYRLEAMVSGGMSPDEAAQIMGAQISHEVVALGKDQVKNYLYTYVMIMALYMVIALYGQMVATNVATEKSSRAMELLITSAKPTSMMFGKVIASCLAGLLQLVAVFGTALVGFQLNRDYWDADGMMASFFDIPLDLLVYMLVFFVLGFFIYAFLYGAVGSTASKLEDINTSVMPLTMVFIASYFVVLFSLTGDSVDSTLMKVCSYIPFSSPMAMFTRIAMSTVPVYEIVISIVILIGSVVGVGVVSAKIYRVGVLLYGTSPKIWDIIKMLRKA